MGKMDRLLLMIWDFYDIIDILSKVDFCLKMQVKDKNNAL